MITDLNIWDNDLLNKIQNLKLTLGENDDVILDAAIEYNYDSIQGKTENLVTLIDIVTSRKANLHIITGTHSNYKLIETSKYVHVHYWPTFWLTNLYCRLSVSPNYQANTSIGLNVENIEVSKNVPFFKYPFISMNKAPKVHRAIMMDMLAKHNLIDTGVVIWREKSQNYPFKYWEERILLYDQVDGFKYQEKLPLEYALSCMQLVPETDENIFTLSEKTGMALFFNKPFLVAGCVHFHKILESFGFKLYEELFDYSFDSVADLQTRYDMIAENFKRYVQLTPHELKDLYLSVFNKCVYNKKLAMQLATDSTLIPEAYIEIVEHHRQNNIDALPYTINKFIRSKENEFRFQ